MKKIKVLQVTGTLRVGGVETVAMNLFRYIDRNKYDFDYLVYGDNIGEYEGEVHSLGGRVLRVPSPRTGYFAFYKAVCRIMKDNGPYDIVHSHVLFNSGIIMRAAARMKIPRRIAHAHDNLSLVKLPFIKRIYNRLMKGWLLRYSTDFLACANSAGYYVFGSEAFYKRGNLLYNAIPVNKFAYSQQDRERIRDEFNLNGKKVIGHIGRLAKQKNHSFLLDIFKEIHEKDENTLLLLVGDGELRGEIEKKIKYLNLQDSVILTGTRADTHCLLSAMDIFLLPSIHEGLAIVLIEAQANGLSCIVPREIVPPESKILDTFHFIAPNAPLYQWVNTVNERLSNLGNIAENERISVLSNNIEDERPSALDNATTKIGGRALSLRTPGAAQQVIKAGYDVGAIGEKISRIYEG